MGNVLTLRQWGIFLCWSKVLFHTEFDLQLWENYDSPAFIHIYSFAFFFSCLTVSAFMFINLCYSEIICINWIWITFVTFIWFLVLHFSAIINCINLHLSAIICTCLHYFHSSAFICQCQNLIYCIYFHLSSFISMYIFSFAFLCNHWNSSACISICFNSSEFVYVHLHSSPFRPLLR